MTFEYPTVQEQVHNNVDIMYDIFFFLNGELQRENVFDLVFTTNFISHFIAEELIKSICFICQNQ
jgi:hypothetical protein